jgi:hypothetical protein
MAPDEERLMDATDEELIPRMERLRLDMAHMTLRELLAVGLELRRRSKLVMAEMHVLDELVRKHAEDESDLTTRGHLSEL